MSYFYNNIVVNQKTPYIYLNNANVKWTEANNIKTLDINSVRFVSPSTNNFRLQSNSPAINTGRDVGSFGVSFDYDGKSRPSGSAYDLGAYEFQVTGPTSNAGPDKSITLPTNSIILNGSGTSATGITGYLWTKKSGPAATLANETTPNLTVTNMVEGAYVFELRVTDANGFALDEVSVNVQPAATNQNPVANAGPDRTITLPTNTLILNGTGTDADGTITSYLWTAVSGPAATLANAGTPNLSLSNLVQGTYVFQLTVTDNNNATASDQVTVTVNPAATNQLPVVNAGNERTIFLPQNQIALTATAFDPDGTIAGILWEKRSGGSATLTNINALTLTASDLVLGIYTFRITVTDNNGATAFAEVKVNVLQGNQSPVANAGPDQTITLPTNTVILTGSGTDSDGTISGYTWTKASGPAATLTNANTATLTVTNMVEGVYVFNLTVTDNAGATGTDQVTVTVSSGATNANELPIALAGGNISFSLPTNLANLYGSGFDPDGSIVSYAWTKASGGSVTLMNQDKPTLTVSNLQAGQYSFRLTVTDNSGAIGTDIAFVTVTEAGTNIFPVASAGANKVIKLPLNSTSLNGSGSDEDGTITTYLWTQTSGTTATILSPSTPTTTVSGLVEGDYTFRLTVTDDKGATAFAEVLIRVINSTSNLPPTVDAGPSVKIFLPTNTLTLNGTASDDGVIASYLWSKLSGPTVTLVNPAELNLSLTNLVLGEYVFKLTVTDQDGASAFDVVRVTVLPESSLPPVVNAGPDQEITFPENQVTLTGTAVSSTGSIVSTLWSKEVGPAAVLAGTTTPTLTVSGMQVGTYLFTYKATDNTGKEASDNVQVIVKPTPPNQPPVVSAGLNQTIELPVNQATLTGSATDADGTIVSLLWSQLSGPSSATLQNETTLTLNALNLIAGNYTFKLEATDNSGNVGSNYAIIYVTSPQSGTDLPPIVFAGEDVTLILPNNSVEITGTAHDPEGNSLIFFLGTGMQENRFHSTTYWWNYSIVELTWNWDSIHFGLQQQTLLFNPPVMMSM
jgi:hypothetical protein